MYDYIKGSVVSLKNNAIVVDNNGIGFFIYVSNPYSFEVGKEYKVYVYQQIKELFYRSKNDEYKENIIYTEKMLKDNNIKYEKSEHGNIFLVTKLSNKICQKYQLSSFEKNKKEYTHIIIFPYHKRKYINSLILEIKDEQHKVKKN